MMKTTIILWPFGEKKRPFASRMGAHMSKKPIAMVCALRHYQGRDKLKHVEVLTNNLSLGSWWTSTQGVQKWYPAKR